MNAGGTEGVPEPSDSELAAWVREWLARTGYLADPEVAAAETVAENRDLWVVLYRIDRELA